MLVVGRGSNLLVADAGFPGIAVLGRPRSAATSTVDVGDRTSPRRVGGGVALPVVARRLASAGWRGFEWAVGVPGLDRRRGAHERRRPRLRHGVVPRHGRRVRPRAPAPPRPAPVDVARAALPGVGPHRRRRGGDAPRSASRPGDRADAEAELADIVRWRRENQPGGQNAGSVFVNPVPGEVSAGQPDRRPRAARLPHRQRLGVGEARQLHPGVRRRVGRRRAGGDRAGAGPGRRRDRASCCAARCAWSGSSPTGRTA